MSHLLLSRTPEYLFIPVALMTSSPSSSLVVVQTWTLPPASWLTLNLFPHQQNRSNNGHQLCMRYSFSNVQLSARDTGAQYMIVLFLKYLDLIKTVQNYFYQNNVSVVFFCNSEAFKY